MRTWSLGLLCTLLLSSAQARQAPGRADELLRSMTLPEKISQLGYNSPAIERLGIPAYVWWNEGLHGVARAGEATVFPQAIGLAATFNPELVREAADAISTEARAKFNLASAAGRRTQYLGLTFWSPNVNIDRDPRWGRGQETYGEDPFLTATMGSAYVRGLQGSDPRWLKAAACAKHFAVHSGPEALRHEFDARVDNRDLRETYLYAFHALVGAGVEAVMCAYNRLNGEPCCTDEALLRGILRKEWGFAGHVVTDCWALDDIWLRHKTIPTRLETAAAAIRAGVDLDCADILQEDVAGAIAAGLLTSASVDSALRPLLSTRLKLGMFEPEGSRPFACYGADSVRSAGHIALARAAAAQSMVLLKNSGVLPLDRDSVRSILVTGPNAASLDALMGNYHGVSGEMVTFAEGISRAAGPAVGVQYDQGCDMSDTVHFGGIWASQNSDVTVAVVGLTPLVEGEDGDAFLSGAGGDKTTLALPAPQMAFLRKLRAAHARPIVVVVTGGSALDVRSIEPYADAILFAWYPGEQGGNALADILFGRVAPSGRLPVTFYRSVDDLPPYEDYAMKERTYRYHTGPVAYPFGFGLSTTEFAYAWKEMPRAAYALGDTLRAAVSVRNTGRRDGDEVVQAYVEYPGRERPLRELKAFRRVTVARGDSAVAALAIPVDDLRKWDMNTSTWRLYPGTYRVRIGKNSAELPLEAEWVVR